MTVGTLCAVAALGLYVTACSVWSVIVCLHIQSEERE